MTSPVDGWDDGEPCDALVDGEGWLRGTVRAEPMLEGVQAVSIVLPDGREWIRYHDDQNLRRPKPGTTAEETK